MLLKNKYKVIIVAPYEENYSQKLISIGCIYSPISIDSKSLSPLKDIYLFIKYLRIMNQFKPNVFLGFTIKPNIYGSIASKILKVPRINNISGLGTVFLKGGILQYLVEFFYKLSLNKSRVVFFQNIVINTMPTRPSNDNDNTN